MTQSIQQCEICQTPFQLNNANRRNRLRRDGATLTICGPNCIAAKRFMLDTKYKIELPIDGHGTSKAYKLGCRCDPCAIHQSTRVREWKRRAVAAGTFKQNYGSKKDYICAFCNQTFQRSASKVKDSLRSSIQKRVFCSRTCCIASQRRQS